MKFRSGRVQRAAGSQTVGLAIGSFSPRRPSSSLAQSFEFPKAFSAFRVSDILKFGVGATFEDSILYFGVVDPLIHSLSLIFSVGTAENRSWNAIQLSAFRNRGSLSPLLHEKSSYQHWVSSIFCYIQLRCAERYLMILQFLSRRSL